jgi:hypothetical protein
MTSTSPASSSLMTRISALCVAATVSLTVLMGIDAMADHEYAAALAASTQASAPVTVAETQTVVITAKRLATI